MRFVVVLKVFMESENGLHVQVCYGCASHQFLCTLKVPNGTTIKEAIALSGLMEKVSSINLDIVKVGIYSKIKALDTVLRENDRVEVYRPLKVDPMVARRRRAEKRQNLKK